MKLRRAVRPQRDRRPRWPRRPRRGRPRSRGARVRWRRPRAAGRRLAVRRLVLALAALAALIIPLPVLASDTTPRQAPCQGASCQVKTALDWTAALSGTGAWSAGDGDAGTVPAVGQAYAAAGGSLAVVGAGLSVTGYRLADGRQLWQTALSAPAGSSIISVRAWPGVVTVGLLAPSGGSRTEVVIDAATGKPLRRYPAAVFGGAVAAGPASTVIVGPAAVTSYDNATGRVRWRHPISGGVPWQADGQTLYLAQPGGSAPVTALLVINLLTGAAQLLSPPLDRPFSGTLALAAGGAVLFSSAAGVTAYDGRTGVALWAAPSVVAEGTDPGAGLVYLASADGTLRGVSPLTGAVRTTIPASLTQGAASVYAVRDGVAFGLDGGADGAAWGYSAAAGRVSWNLGGLPWPHFFSDLSGLGGSAAVAGDMVVIAVCPHQTAAALCADPELAAFDL